MSNQPPTEVSGASTKSKKKGKKGKEKRRYGEGRVYQPKGSSKFCIRWRQDGQRLHESGFPDEKEAEKALRKKFVDIDEGRAAPLRRRSTPTLAEEAVKWLERRKVTRPRSWRDDASRWRVHLGPFFGRQRPAEVKASDLRRFVEAKIVGGKISSTTIGHCVRLLSVFFSDLIERGLAPGNPVRLVPREVRRLYKNAHDPRTTAFLERQQDIAAMYRALAQPFATIFAVGVLAGLRPGEVLALEWGDVDLGTRRITVKRQVRHGRVGPPKSGKPRFVPIGDALAKILSEWRLATGGEGQLFRPENPKVGGRPGAPPRFLGTATVQDQIGKALKACGLPETLSLYQITRHTYASQFVLGGGSIEKLQVILGHANVVTTQRYAHLRADMFRPSDLPELRVDLTRAGGAVIDLGAHREGSRAGADGQILGTGEAGGRSVAGASTEDPS